MLERTLVSCFLLLKTMAQRLHHFRIKQSKSWSTLKVRKAVMNFFLSPTRMTLDKHGSSRLIASSICVFNIFNDRSTTFVWLLAGSCRGEYSLSWQALAMSIVYLLSILHAPPPNYLSPFFWMAFTHSLYLYLSLLALSFSVSRAHTHKKEPFFLTDSLRLDYIQSANLLGLNLEILVPEKEDKLPKPAPHFLLQQWWANPLFDLKRVVSKR